MPAPLTFPRILQFLAGAVVGGFLVLMATKVWPYRTLEPGINFLTTKSEAINSSLLFRIGFYVHISSSLWVVGAGLAQFFPRWFQGRARLHRNLGKLYVVSILALAGPSGLILAAYANGG